MALHVVCRGYIKGNARKKLQLFAFGLIFGTRNFIKLIKLHDVHLTPLATLCRNKRRRMNPEDDQDDSGQQNKKNCW